MRKKLLKILVVLMLVMQVNPTISLFAETENIDETQVETQTEQGSGSDVITPNVAQTASDEVVPTINWSENEIFANGVELHLKEGERSGLTEVYYKSASGDLIPFDLDKHMEGVQHSNYLANFTIYGGSLNESVHSTSIVVEGGEVASIYGGGLSVQREGVDAANANVETDTSISISAHDELDMVVGGGYSLAPATTADVNGNTYVQVNGDVRIGMLIGGGMVSTNIVIYTDMYNETKPPYFARVHGTTNVTVQGASISYGIFGGGFADNQSQEVENYNPNIDVSVNQTNINMDDGFAQSIYGGGISTNANSLVKTNTNVNVSDANVGAVHGGSYAALAQSIGRVAGNTNVTINSSNITNVYGGGAVFSRGEDTRSSEAEVENAIQSLNTSVEANTNVFVNNSVVSNVFGGAKHGNVLGDTNVTISDNSRIEEVYGGGAGMLIEMGKDSFVLIPNYVLGNTNVNLNHATITKVYGGGANEFGYSASTTGVGLNVYTNESGLDGNYIVSEKGNTNIIINGATVHTSVIGGAADTGYIQGSTHITIHNGVIDGDVFGGSDTGGCVRGNTNITVYDGIFNGNLYGGGISSKIGYGYEGIDQVEFGKEVELVPVDGLGNATIKVFGGAIGQDYIGEIIGCVFVSGSYSVGGTPENVRNASEELDAFLPKNNGNGYVFIDHDVEMLGNVYEAIFKDATLVEDDVEYDLNLVMGETTVIMDQVYNTNSSLLGSSGGIGVAIVSLESGIFETFETGTGLEYNGEGLNILRIQQLNEDAIESSGGEVLQSAAENGAWSMPHWSIQGDVVLHEDVVQNIAIIENQELYLPLDATLAVQGATPLSNEGYIVTAHGDLGNGLETGFVNNTTSNATSRIYRGDAANSMSVNPSVSNYKVNDSATPITASVGNNYTFLANGTKITYADTTWQKDGVAYSSTSGQITPTTDAAGVFTYTASTPFEVQFESVLQASGLMNNGNAQASAVVNVGLYNITFDPDGGVFPDGDTNAKVDMTDSSGKLTNTVTQPTKEGYTFEGWSIENEVISTQEAQDRVFTSDATLVAVWKKTSTSPTTGDTTNILLYMALVMFAIGGVMASKQQLKR